MMDRRKLLKSLGALGLAPLLPNPAIALSATNTASATVATEAFSRSYQLAEMLVRSHNKCSVAMLERLLCVDTGTAAAVKSELLKRGVIGINANAYGIHTATKPFHQGGLFNSNTAVERIGETVKEKVNDALAGQDEGLEIEDGREEEQIENAEDKDPEAEVNQHASCETDNPSIDQT